MATTNCAPTGEWREVSFASSLYLSHWPTWFWYVSSLACSGYLNWMNRYAMNADGQSYLDMARRHDFINGLWSPLYPMILSVFLGVLHPSPEQSFVLVHLVNWLIFGATLAAYVFFLRRARVDLPHWFTFPLFLWAYVLFSDASIETPDLCVAACVFVLAGLYCRMKEQG